jgi:hypothetical protein
VVAPGIILEVQTREPIFEKCSHLREKGGVVALRTAHWVVLTHTVSIEIFQYLEHSH